MFKLSHYSAAKKIPFGESTFTSTFTPQPPAVNVAHGMRERVFLYIENWDNANRNYGEAASFQIEHHLLSCLNLLVTVVVTELLTSTAVFLNRRAAARYRALASIIPGRERFS